jgi:hypothetical protein
MRLAKNQDIPEITPKSDAVAHLNDCVSGAWEGLTTTQTSRAGDTATRVASALASGVDPKVVALQINLNVLKNTPDTPATFSAEDVEAIRKLYVANRRRCALTKQQTDALICGQKRDEDGCHEFLVSHS